MDEIVQLVGVYGPVSRLHALLSGGALHRAPRLRALHTDRLSILTKRLGVDDEKIISKDSAFRTTCY